MSASAVIDSLEFAQTGQHIGGSLPLSSLTRLQDAVAEASGEIAFEVTGGKDERNRPLLRLRVRGLLKLQCQRCLGKLDYPLDLSSTILVVPQGSHPDDTDDPLAPDYIEAETELDLPSLIEDEVLLALPFSPRHDGACGGAFGTGGDEHAKSSPFGALAALKNSGKTQGL